MSGGCLVVLDREGRATKQYPLPSGAATIGRAPNCNIRILLPGVTSHHATVVVHANQTIVRDLSGGGTLVNGRAVSVAALRHGDTLAVAGRALRWLYEDGDRPRMQKAEGALAVRPRRGPSGRRASSPARAPAPASSAADRHSMPASPLHGNTRGKQVAIVQPQRRDNAEHNGNTSATATKASQWIESRKAVRRTPATPAPPSPTRASLTPARASLTPARANVTSARASLTPTRASVTPARANVTSGRVSLTPARANVTSARASLTPARANVTSAKASLTPARANLTSGRASLTPARANVTLTRSSVTPAKSNGTQARVRATTKARVTLTPGRVSLGPRAKSTPLRTALLRNAHSAHKARVMKIEAPLQIDHTKQAALLLMTRHTSKAKVSPTTQTRKKSSPSFVVRKRSSGTPGSGARVSRGSRVAGVARVSRNSGGRKRSTQSSPQSITDSTITDSPLLPSPKKSSLKDPANKSRKNESIKFDLSNLEFKTSDATPKSPSRGKRLLQAVGSPLPDTSGVNTSQELTPRGRRSQRSSLIVQKVLDASATFSDQSWDTTAASAFESRILSPRSAKNLETYSIVDLVSLDSNETAKSVYDSVGSTRSSSFAFGTPQTTGRKTRSTIDPALMTSSTPYVKNQRPTRSTSNPNTTRNASINSAPRRSKSLTTPENTQSTITLNSTRISRASKSKSRLPVDESDLQYISSRLDFDATGDSPKSSKRSTVSRVTLSPKNKRNTRNLTLNTTATFVGDGTVTPENTQSPVEASTPVLSIKSLLDSSQSSFASQSSPKRNPRKNLKRKTIGTIRPERKGRSSIRSKSLNLSKRAASLRLTRGSPELNDSNVTDVSENITPKSGVKVTPEAVKNKHSTAKKSQSKRSIIDDLNESDIMKQLFNSPVKRKLSQSMTEFSRRQLFDDEVLPKRPTRNTIAVYQSPDNSLLNNTGCISPEQFVSPMNTPETSPNLTGVKRLFRKNTPNNDLSNVRGVKSLLKTPRARKSIKNDLTNVSGVKLIFAKSPKNRLSDVRVKEIFKEGPKNNLRVSGVKQLFQAQKEPKNDLSDVRGVRKLYQRKSAANDLRNVSGVKKTLAKSPKNDLRDVRGVRLLFRQEKSLDSNVSGIEALFNESNTSQRSEVLFDQLVGRPKAKAVYSKSFTNRVQKKTTARKGKSLHYSMDAITNNVHEWLEGELQKRNKTSTTKANKSLNKSTKISRELQKLATDTVEGTSIRKSRARNSTLIKSQLDIAEGKRSASELYSAHTLPIKKRSLVGALDKSKIEKANLPIKKRAVLHSTPVKGQYNFTMNASELGRVSPIAAIDKTRTLDKYQTERQPEPKPPSLRTKSGTKSNIPEPPAVETHPTRKGRPIRKEQSTVVISSPKRRRGKQTDTQTESPKTGRRKAKSEIPTQIEAKPKRTRKTTEKLISNASPKAGTSKASTTKTSTAKTNTAKPSAATSITTKASAAKNSTAKASSAKTSTAKASAAKASTSTAKEEKTSPRKTRAKQVKSPAKRATRGKAKSDVTELANTKKRRQSLVVSKRQPVSKPGPKKAKAKESPKKAEPKKTKVSPKKKAEPKSKESPKKKAEPKKAKESPKKKAAPKGNKAKGSPIKAAPRGRKAKESPKKKPVPKAKKSPVKDTPKKVVVTRRQAKTEDKPRTPKTTRARVNKTNVVVVKPSPVIKPLRATRGKVEAKISPSPRKQGNKRGRSVADKSIDEPKSKRVRNNKTVSVEEKKPRGKTVIATPEPKTRRKGNEKEKPQTRKRVLTMSVNDTEKDVPAKRTKGTRGEPNSYVEATSSKTEGKTRDRKAVEVASPSPKGRRKANTTQVETKTTRGRKAAAASPKTKRAANTTPTAKATRSRRR